MWAGRLGRGGWLGRCGAVLGALLLGAAPTAAAQVPRGTADLLELALDSPVSVVADVVLEGAPPGRRQPAGASRRFMTVRRVLHARGTLDELVVGARLLVDRPLPTAVLRRLVHCGIGRHRAMPASGLAFLSPRSAAGGAWTLHALVSGVALAQVKPRVPDLLDLAVSCPVVARVRFSDVGPGQAAITPSAILHARHELAGLRAGATLPVHVEIPRSSHGSLPDEGVVFLAPPAQDGRPWRLRSVSVLDVDWGLWLDGLEPCLDGRDVTDAQACQLEWVLGLLEDAALRDHGWQILERRFASWRFDRVEVPLPRSAFDARQVERVLTVFREDGLVGPIGVRLECVNVLVGARAERALLDVMRREVAGGWPDEYVKVNLLGFALGALARQLEDERLAELEVAFREIRRDRPSWDVESVSAAFARALEQAEVVVEATLAREREAAEFVGPRSEPPAVDSEPER